MRALAWKIQAEEEDEEDLDVGRLGRKGPLRCSHPDRYPGEWPLYQPCQWSFGFHLEKSALNLWKPVTVASISLLLSSAS